MLGTKAQWIDYLETMGKCKGITLYTHTSYHYQLDIEDWVLFDIWIPAKEDKLPRWRVNAANIKAKPQPRTPYKYTSFDFTNFKMDVQTAISTRRRTKR